MHRHPITKRDDTLLSIAGATTRLHAENLLRRPDIMDRTAEKMIESGDLDERPKCPRCGDMGQFMTGDPISPHAEGCWCQASSFTPGPLTIGQKGYGYTEIRAAHMKSPAFPHGPLVAVVYQAGEGIIGRREAAANAALFTAAPDLYAACERLLYAAYAGDECECDNYVNEPECGNRCPACEARAALAKARQVRP